MKKETEKQNPPVYYLELIKFRLKPDEILMFCALWQKAISFKNNFTFTIFQAANELNYSKHQYSQIINYFEKLEILIIKRGMYNKRRFEVNFPKLCETSTLKIIFKNGAIDEYQKKFQSIKTNIIPERQSRLNYHYYLKEIRENKNKKYTDEYILFFEFLEGKNPIGKPLEAAFELEPITYKEYENLCYQIDSEVNYKPEYITKIEIINIIQKIFNDKRYYRGKESMTALLSDWVKKEIDYELRHHVIKTYGKKKRIEFTEAAKNWRFPTR